MRKWLAILLAALMLFGTFSGTALAVQPSESDGVWEDQAHKDMYPYNMILPAATLKGACVVAGETMKMGFALYNVGWEGQQYNVEIYSAKDDQNPVARWQSPYPDTGLGGMEKTIAWDTTGLEPGQYTLRVFTTETVTGGQRVPIEDSQIEIPVAVTTEAVALEGLGFYDLFGELRTELVMEVDGPNALDGIMELEIGCLPQNTTADRTVQVTCDNPAVLEMDCLGGYIFLRGLKEGMANLTVTGGGKKTVLPVRVGELPESGFYDVSVNAWYYKAVKYVSENSLMAGTGNGNFSPNAPLDRSMLVTILYRYEGKPEVSGTSSFTDVPNGKWYSDAIAWAQENSIVAGITETTFAPFQPVTREQMAAIFYRYAAKSEIDTSERASLDRFADGNRVSNYAKDAISWCVAKGILSGSGGKLNPKDSATRAEFASILMRYITKVAEAS